MELDFFYKILTSAVLWWLIWLERDISNKSENEQFAGLRTFSLMAIMWTLWYFLDSLYNSKIIFSLWLFIAITTFILISYTHSTFKKDIIGITSEMTWILTYFIGVLVWFNMLKISIIFTISILVIISLKDRFAQIKEKISKEEFLHTLKFAVIAFVVLPLLPNSKFSINNILSFLWIIDKWIDSEIMKMAFFNPYSIWFFVVIMSAVWYIWYILSKIFWKNSSVMLSSFIWWLVSSTAVTATMSEQSKKDEKNPYIYILWVLIANSVMLIRVIFIVLFLNIALFWKLIAPAILMLLWFFIIMFYSYNKSKTLLKNTHVNVEEKVKSPFSIIPALKFWLFILFIKFVAWIWLIYKDLIWWDMFYYLFWIISWFADVDAITQTMTLQSKELLVDSKIAIATILLAVMSNNIVKGSMAYKFWAKKFSKIVAFAFTISIILWIFWILLF